MSGLLGQLGLAALMKGMGGGGGSRRRSTRAPVKKYVRTIKRMKRSAPYRMSRKFPGSKYGYSATPRSAETLAAFGETWRKATDEQKAARTAQRYFGKGPYSGPFVGHHHSVGNNVMLDCGMDTKPSFQNVNDEMGAIMITHHEYIKDIYGGAQSVFDADVFYVNPGLEDTFPWLSQVGANFEEYEFTQCVFEFRSTIGMSAVTTSGQVGQIMMAPQYNAGLPDYPDKLSLLSSYSPVSARTTDNVSCGLECDFSKRAGAKVLRVRTAPVFVDQDIKTYDLCKLQVSQLAMPSTFANQQLGELWVSYSVILRKPKLNSGSGNTISEDLFQIKATGSNVPFGTLPTNLWAAQQNNLGCSLSATTGAGNRLTITFPTGASAYYEVKLIWWGDPITSDDGTVHDPIILDGVTGALEAVADIPYIDPTGDTASTYVSYQAEQGLKGSWWIGHFKCSTQFSGVASTAVFDCASTNMNIGSVQITEYNTLNGAGSPPLFVNKNAISAFQ